MCIAAEEPSVKQSAGPHNLGETDTRPQILTIGDKVKLCIFFEKDADETWPQNLKKKPQGTL